MKNLTIILVALCLTRSVSLEAAELPRRHNIISKYLDGMLDRLFQKLSAGNFSIPDVELGEGVGRVFNVVADVHGELEKQLDGKGGFGLELFTEGKKISFKGQYHFLNLTLPGLFPVFGEGNFTIHLEAVSLNVSLKAQYSSSEEKFFFDLNKLNVSVLNSTVRFENLMNDPNLADFLNTLISSLIPDVTKMLQGHILKLGKHFIESYGNGIIMCIKDNILSPEKTQQCIQDLFKSIYDNIDHELGTYLMRRNVA